VVTFRRIAVPQLDAATYLAENNPGGWALAMRMKLKELTPFNVLVTMVDKLPATQLPQQKAWTA
jgi:hypothetical protein